MPKAPSRVSRRQSDASRRNATAIVEAAAAEIEAVGVDHLTMTKVARRARLTTGALYSRYETSTELAADVWTQLVGPPTLDAFDDIVAAIVDGDRPAFDRTRERLRVPAPEILVGLELVAVARRIDELDEVIAPGLADAFARWVPDDEPVRRARVAAAVGAAWGTLLHCAPGGLRLDWAPVMRLVRWSCRQPYDPDQPVERFALGGIPDYSMRTSTDDPIDDALIAAAVTIIGRVGLKRATNTRIARRAGVTSGAIYGRYRTKEALLERTFGTAVADWYGANLDRYRAITAAAGRPTGTASDPGATASDAFDPPGNDWPAFRLEAQIAAMHNPCLAHALNAVQDDAQRAYIATVNVGSAINGDAAATFARLSHIMPLGLSMVEMAVPSIGPVEWRRALAPLERFA